MAQILTTTILDKKRVPLGTDLWIADAACRGMRVRIAHSANAGRTVTFYYRYRDRITGKLKPVSLGQYPGQGLEYTRRLVNEKLRAIADSGSDVRQYLKRERAQGAEDEHQTIIGMIPDYLAYKERRGLAAGTLEGYRRHLRPLAVWWGNRNPNTITRGDVQDLFDRVKKEGVPPFDIDGTTPIKQARRGTGGHRAAGQTLSAGRAYWSWLVDREVVQFNPWKDQKKLSEESQSGISGRSLNDDEIAQLLQNASSKLSHRDHTILQFMLATGLRPIEVCAAEWKEIDLKSRRWTIPAARMKYKKADHLVFLSSYVEGVLTDWRGTQHGRHKYVFPTEGAVREYVVPDNLVERFRQLEIEGFTPKVCRATVRTGLQRLGCPTEVRSRISHHQFRDRVAKSYDHYDYDTEAKHWWEMWGDHIKKLESGEQGLAEVVNIQQA
jgi:integrase